MSIVTKYIKWIMLISGALTFTLIYAAIAPQQAMSGMFGTTLNDPVALVIVRNWGILVALIGLMLIYGAFQPSARISALIIAGASKVAFIVLVISYTRQQIGLQLGLSIGVDVIFVALFAAFLLTSKTAINR